MRHRKKGRQLGRSSSHRKAMLRNLVTSLILTERDPDYFEGLYQADGKTPVSPPKYKGRVVTTLQKAKEARTLIEKCVTIARKAIPHDDKADDFDTDADRNSSEWETWRKSDEWKKWVDARAPGVAARRRVFDILRDKEAVAILFEEIAPRYEDRPGGYTRVLKLAKPRLGDAGAQAILEFVGRYDRTTAESEAPTFESDEEGAIESDQDDEVLDSTTEDEEVGSDEAETSDADSDASEDSQEDDSKQE